VISVSVCLSVFVSSRTELDSQVVRRARTRADRISQKLCLSFAIFFAGLAYTSVLYSECNYMLGPYVFSVL